MIDVCEVFAPLVGAAMLAGYLPVRYLTVTWPRTSRLALQPLAGAGLIAITLGGLTSPPR